MKKRSLVGADTGATQDNLIYFLGYLLETLVKEKTGSGTLSI